MLFCVTLMMKVAEIEECEANAEQSCAKQDLLFGQSIFGGIVMPV